jgi:HNH endonuclease
MTREEFLAAVDRTGECWVWMRARAGSGYGRVRWNGRDERAHRVAWLLANGPVPEGLCVLHRCDNPPCVRPDHLFLGTKADNAQDCARKGRNSSVVHPEAHRAGIKRWLTEHPERHASGERNGAAKLTAQQAAEIRSLRGQVSQRELARRFGVSKAAIYYVQIGRNWSVQEFPR